MLQSPRFIAAFLVFTIAMPAIVHAASAPSPTFNTTGTWTGSYSCKGVDAGAKSKFTVKDATMTISQIAATAAVMHIEAGGTGGGSFTYNGNVSEVADKPGQGAGTFVECATRSDFNDYDEVLAATNIKITPSAKDAAKAKFVAISTVHSGTLVGAVCKFTFDRTSTDDPIVSGCAPTCPVGPPT